MQDIFFNFLNYTNFLSYFSVEFILILGILFSLIPYYLFISTKSLSRLSDYTTAGSFIITTLILFSLGIFSYIKQTPIDLNIFNNNFVINNFNIILKLALNIFGLFFILTSYKSTRKFIIRVPLLNSILLSIILFGGLLLNINNLYLSFFILELIIYLIYKYNSLVNKPNLSEIKSLDFIAYNVCAGFLCIVFLILNSFVVNKAQLNIVQLLLTLSVFLKIGIFPLCNHSMLNIKKAQTPFLALFYNLVPYCGVIFFDKLIPNILISGTYQFSLLVFASLTILSYAIYSYKQKNLFQLLSNSASYLYLVCILNIICNNDSQTSIIFATLILFSYFAVYSVLSSCKIKTSINKYNFNAFKGIFRKHKKFSIFLSLTLLFAFGIIPNYSDLFLIQCLKNLYLFDKIGFYISNLIILGYLLITINILNFIKVVYTIDKSKVNENFEYKKGTIFNYIIPFGIFIIILILFLIGR